MALLVSAWKAASGSAERVIDTDAALALLDNTITADSMQHM